MSHLNKFKVLDLIDISDYYDTGVDYLRLSFTRKLYYFELLLIKLDTDNSSFLYEDINGQTYTVQKVFASIGPSLIFSIVYNDLSIPMFTYTEFKMKEIKKKSKIDFYGSCFRMIQIDVLPPDYVQMVVDFLFIDEDPEITRIDYRVDFMFRNTVPVLKRNDLIDKKEIYPLTMLKSWTNNEIANRSIGNKASKRVYIRFYDKLVDSREKNKFFIYSDYFNYAGVKRLEFECGYKFTKGFRLSTLQNLTTKINILLKLYNGDVNKIFDDKKYIPVETINQYNKVPIISQFVKKGLLLKKNGFDPFQLLEEYFVNKDV